MGYNNKVPTVWDPRYTSSAAPLTSTTKQAAVVALAQNAGLISIVAPPEPDLSSVWAEIATIHDPSYVEAVRTGEPRKWSESQGFTWSPEFADSVARIWAGHAFAAQLAQVGQGFVLHPVSGAHHAMRERGWGFCTFNYLVPKRAPRTLVIDLDAHYGDGTEALAGLGVFHYDIYGGKGSKETDRGCWYGVGNRQEYFSRLSNLPAWIAQVEPDLIYWQAGVDVLDRDPVGGISGMTERFVAIRDRFVAEIIADVKIPTVVTLAGGYTARVEHVHLLTIRELARVIGQYEARAS